MKGIFTLLICLFGTGTLVAITDTTVTKLLMRSTELSIMEMRQKKRRRTLLRSGSSFNFVKRKK